MTDTEDSPTEPVLRQVKASFGGLVPPSVRTAARPRHARRAGIGSDDPERNKISYRLNHWPIWIWVFFIAPGPMTFDLFAHGFDWRMAAWLGIVLLGTGTRGAARQAARRRAARRTSSASPRTGRIRCTGGSATRSRGARSITFAVLNIAGLVVRDRDGRMAAAADLRGRVLSDRGHDLGAGRARAGCRASNRRRRAKATSAAISTDRSGRSAIAQPSLWLLWTCCRAAARGTRSSWPSSSASSRASAIRRAAVCFRARGRSSLASWRFRTDGHTSGGVHSRTGRMTPPPHVLAFRIPHSAIRHSYCGSPPSPLSKTTGTLSETAL